MRLEQDQTFIEKDFQVVVSTTLDRGFGGWNETTALLDEKVNSVSCVSISKNSRIFRWLCLDMHLKDVRAMVTEYKEHTVVAIAYWDHKKHDPVCLLITNKTRAQVLDIAFTKQHQNTICGGINMYSPKMGGVDYIDKRKKGGTFTHQVRGVTNNYVRLDFLFDIVMTQIYNVYLMIGDWQKVRGRVMLSYHDFLLDFIQEVTGYTMFPFKTRGGPVGHQSIARNKEAACIWCERTATTKERCDKGCGHLHQQNCHSAFHHAMEWCATQGVDILEFSNCRKGYEDLKKVVDSR